MLRVKNGTAGCLFAVSISSKDCNKKHEEIDSKVQKTGLVIQGQSASYLDYESSLNFVFSGGGIIKGGSRYQLVSTEVPMDLFGSKEKRNMHAFVCVHPELNLAVFSFHISILGFHTEDVVTLNQAISGGFDIRTHNTILGEKKDLKSLMKAYIDTFRKQFPAEKQDAFCSDNFLSKELNPYILLEIKELKSSTEDLSVVDNPIYMLETYPQEFYGMITGDEGYMYVPQARALEMLGDYWTTRDFFAVVPFLMGALSINLSASPRHINYIAHQEQYNSTRIRKVNPYFNVYQNKEIAGLSHGVAVMIEEGLVVRRLLDRILLSKVLETNKDMRITLKTRKEIITTINRIASLNIMEIDSLEKLIISKMNILQDLEKVKYNLDLNQSEIDIKYSRAINTMVILFAVLQALIAIFTILSRFLG